MTIDKNMQKDYYNKISELKSEKFHEKFYL